MYLKNLKNKQKASILYFILRNEFVILRIVADINDIIKYLSLYGISSVRYSADKLDQTSQSRIKYYGKFVIRYIIHKKIQYLLVFDQTITILIKD